MTPGLVIIIIQDPGRGDSTSATIHFMDGVLDGDTTWAGLTPDSDMDMDSTDVATVAAGGVPLSIIRLIGVDGMVAQGHTDFTEDPSTCGTISG
jgi:hypothetical protein